MKKLYSLLAIIALTAFVTRSFSQIDIALGTGTNTNPTGATTAAAYPCPLQDYYETTHAQYLYRASELINAGMQAGLIKGIKFTVISVNGAGVIENYSIKIGGTTATALSTTSWISGTSSKYGPTNYQPIAGQNAFSFTSDFMWNGTDNIVVEVCSGENSPLSSGNTFTNNPLVTWTTGLGFTASHTYRADDATINCDPSGVTTNTGTTTTRPNIIFQWIPATPCTGTPTAGTASVNPSNVCIGQTISLSLTGSTVASGITYQWEKSTDNFATPGIPVAPASQSSGLSGITQTVTTQYRCIVTCTNPGGSAVTSNIVTVTSPAPFGGTYTIDKDLPASATNFTSFNSAINAMKCGIVSAVVFNVNGSPSTPYNEQVINIPFIPGSSPTNTITFNGNGVPVQFPAATNAERAIFKLRGAKFFIFDSLNINASGTTYGYGFQLLDNSDSNIIRKCVITTNSTVAATSQNYAGIVVNGDASNPIGSTAHNCDGNLFEKNIIDGGYVGISISSSFSIGLHQDNKIIGNEIRNFGLHGVYVAGTIKTFVNKNYIHRPTRTTVGDFNGITFASANNYAALVEKNKITNGFGGAPTSTSNFYGINFNSSDAAIAYEDTVRNNLIYDGLSGNGIAHGISNTGSDFVYYINNTVALHNLSATTTSGTTRGFSFASLTSGVYLYNNIISIRRGGTAAKHAIYFGGGRIVGSDNNVYYINAAGTNNHIGYLTANRTTFADWQTALGPIDEIASINQDPAFTDPLTLDFKPQNAAINDKGLNLGLAIDDILDVVRPGFGGVEIDPGAYEFLPPGCSIPPVTGVTTISPTSLCQNNPVLLNLIIGGYGSGQTFQWQYAATLAGPWSNVGAPLLTPDTTINADTTGYYRVEIVCNGGTAVYTNPELLTVTPALKSAIYTIGDPTNVPFVPGTAGGNFATFNDAKNAMQCGITGGPVVFNVASGSGPYNEQLVLGNIKGTSDVNTITFNGNGRTLNFSSTNNAERAVIKLNGSKYIRFNNLVVDATGTNAYGYGIQLLNDADSNIIKGCTIISNSTLTNTNHAGIVISANATNPTALGTTLSDFNLIDSNKIVGGYYGITLIGSGTATDYINDNKITRNTIQDFYSAGIQLGGTSGTLIEKNDISRPLRTSVTTTYGINIAGAPNNGLIISKNRIHNLFDGALTSTAIQYAINHSGASTEAAIANIVSNNLIYNLNGNGNTYGLYNNSADNIKYYHNTISLDDAAATGFSSTDGFYQTSAANGIEFINNIISISRGGSGVRHALVYQTNTSDILSDNNVLYVKPRIVSGVPLTTDYIGQYGSVNYNNLTQWKTASLKDANSFDLDPVYKSPATVDFSPNNYKIDNKGTLALANPVTDDIIDITRSIVTPDIGAFEFSPIQCTEPPVAGTASVTPNSGTCLEVPISLDLTGHSPIGTLKFIWQASSSATGPWINISDTLPAPKYDTVTSVTNYYRCAVICTGAPVYSNVVNVALNNYLLAGTYTINGANPTNWTGQVGANFNTFQEAVNAMNCGIGGNIVFNVAAGTYNERIRISYVPGVSATSTVVFQGATGNAADAILSYDATSAPNYTLQLDSAKYFTFRNLSFASLNTANARVIEFKGTTSYTNILDNIITAPTVTTTNNTASAVYAIGTGTGAFSGTNVVLKGNTINNGSNGILFSGLSQTSLASANRLLIDSNTVNSAYSHGIFTQFTTNLQITRNTVNVNSAVAANTAGIHTQYNDSLFVLKGNKINISNTTAAVMGIYVQNTRGNENRGLIGSNTILATAGNTNTVHGLRVSTSESIDVINNVIGINNAGATAQSYGLYSENNANAATSDSVTFYNNTVNYTATSTNGYAGYFTNSTPALAPITVYNNIFSNKGGGRALFVNVPNRFIADYNLLYATGTNLVQVQTPAANYTNLKTWKATWNWDFNSISIEPALVSDTDLRPEISNANSWAMNGRGVQVLGNTKDFNDAARPELRTQGVPDLGAYEFYPSVIPPALLATPALPVANGEQVFSFGTDTVQRITWGPSVPASITLRRYSGDVGPRINVPPRTDSMYFYTQVDTLNPNDYQFATKLYYYDSWLGPIEDERKLGLGRTARPGSSWAVSFTSKTNATKNEIDQKSLLGLDKFTGLFNPFAPTESEDSSSNRGKDFWVGYQRSYDFSATGGTQQMVLYFGAGDQPADVTVTIEGTAGTPWVRTYQVPANSAIQSDFIPKTGTDDARLTGEGLFSKKGIHIESTASIAAYAHIYAGANSGATMLLPTSVWGYEFYTMNSEQSYISTNSHSVFHIVAQHDSTWVEINPSKPTTGGWTTNGGTRPNGSYLVKLNKGDAYQVQGTYISGSVGNDLTGSYVKSIANGQDSCFPIAVFAGSSRTYITCTNATTASGGDLIIQQIFPYQAWGTKYITAPTFTAPSITQTDASMSIEQNVFRVMVKDPTTVVTRNGNPIPGGLIAGRYYEFNSNTPDVIQSDKPVLVAQYIASDGGGCTGQFNIVGDPEMFYLSPLEQAINKTQFYRNELSNISFNFITIIIPTEGLASLKIDGLNHIAQPISPIIGKNIYTHPNIPGYSVVTFKWIKGVGFSKVESDLPFTGIVYGLGGVESYGYSMGTMVKNLNNKASVDNDLNTNATPTEYTCEGAPFTIRALLPVQPQAIKWLFSEVEHLNPNVDSMQNAPVASGTQIVDGILYYVYEINVSLTYDSAGVIGIPIEFWSNELESCEQKKRGILPVQVFPAPETDFDIVYPSGGTSGCEGDIVNFLGSQVTLTGIGVNKWEWEFSPTDKPTGQNQTQTYPSPGTYNVRLKTTTLDGCLSDTTKQVEILAKPVVDVVQASVAACVGESATFQVLNPQSGITYNWYDAATGGNLLGTGPTFNATNLNPPVSFWVEGVNVNCASLVRKQVDVTLTSPLSPVVVTVQSATANSVTFTWTGVTGANSYEASVDGGLTFVPVTGPGLTHTVTGLGTLQSVSVIIKAIGSNSCQVSNSSSANGCSNSAAAVVANNVQVCLNTSATFNVLSPESGITYNWYNAATGGVSLHTGATFTSPAVTGTTSYYVEQSNTTSGCVGSVRTQVTATLLPALPNPAVSVDSTGINFVTFQWNPVTGAATYEVSLDNGATWITPSSGATGLSHTVTGLTPAQEVTIQVRATGVISCLTSIGTGTGRADIDQIFIPNTFTPNADGKNDVLMVYANIIQSMVFTVYNQWGEKLYETRSQNQGWDGSYKGKQQPVGVYLYVGRFILKDGSVVERKGSINLVR